MRLDLLFGKKKCRHENFNIDRDFGYCPDCGELIENQWFITRCSCCGIKQRAIVRNGKVVPIEKFCHNCGTNKYIVEQLEKIDFININFAVVIQKTSTNYSFKSMTQSWVDTKRIDDKPKLLPIFR